MGRAQHIHTSTPMPLLNNKSHAAKKCCQSGTVFVAIPTSESEDSEYEGPEPDVERDIDVLEGLLTSAIPPHLRRKAKPPQKVKILPEKWKRPDLPPVYQKDSRTTGWWKTVAWRKAAKRKSRHWQLLCECQLTAKLNGKLTLNAVKDQETHSWQVADGRASTWLFWDHPLAPRA